jgi:hypothetical protein
MRLPHALTQRWIAIPVVFAGAAILLTAVPRTISAVVSGAGEPAIRRIEKQEPVSLADLATVIDAQQRGLFWAHDPQMEATLGLAHLLAAEQTTGGGARDADIRLELARQALRASLGRSPANPYPWTLLAYTEYLRAKAWNDAAQSALRMAIITGPHEPAILWSRLRLALLAWDVLGPQDRDLVMDQIRFAWSRDPEHLIKLAVDLGALNTVRVALLTDHDASAEFERLVKESPNKS